MRKFLLVVMLCLTACAPTETAPSVTPQLVRVNSSQAARMWLGSLYDCADQQQIILSFVNDPQSADISLRLGEPDQLTTPAFQIGQDDLLVVTNPANPLQKLERGDVQELFARPDKQDIQIWVFAAGDDIQQVFERDVLEGGRVSSLARLALTPRQMQDALDQDQNAVGILPRHLKTAAMRELFVLPNLPVLALLKSEPQGQITTLLACLQK